MEDDENGHFYDIPTFESGSNQSQSSRAPYGPRQTHGPDTVQCTAPQPERIADYNYFPFHGPGSSGNISPSAFREFPHQHPQNLVWYDSDILINDPTFTHDSTYHTSTQTPYPTQIGLVPDCSLLIESYIPQSIPYIPYQPSPHQSMSDELPVPNNAISSEYHQHPVAMMKAIQPPMLGSSAGKRPRWSPALDDPHYLDPSRGLKIPRIEKTRPPQDNLVFPELPPISKQRNATRVSSRSKLVQTGAYALNKKQKKLIRQWYRSLTEEETHPSAVGEMLNPLAMLTKAPPQSVFEYISSKLVTSSTNPDCIHEPNSQPVAEGDGYPTTNAYSLISANKHLPRNTLQLVEKYVLACQRRRGKDGRRKVNTGPYQCTFGCGYQTKRVFDWKRHEETHEPQELWLCTRCDQSGEQNPFLVNRKDKFLKHAKDAHKASEPEIVLERSRLPFVAAFDSKCPRCPESGFESWDERCRHVVTHFEDDIHSLRPNKRRKSASKNEGTLETEVSSSDASSDSADSSDDDDNGQNGFARTPEKRDPTGGSGGGSGTFGELHLYKGGAEGPTRNCNDSGGHASTPYANGGSFSRWTSVNIPTASFQHHKSFPGRNQVISHPTRYRHDHLSQRDSQSQALPTLNRGPWVFPLEVQQSPAVPTVYSSEYIVNKVSVLGGSNDLPPVLGASYILGSGSHGSVDAVQHVDTGRVYARKRSRHLAFSREVEILKSLKHPHIVAFVAAYVQNSLLNLIMSPVCQSTLGDLMEDPKAHVGSFAQVHSWIGCLSSALAYIHSRRIRHADIKPQNILLRGSKLFITDFGISRLVSEPDSDSSSNSPATPLYSPKEIAERSNHGRRADVFSLGCVVLELLTCLQGKSVQDLHRYLCFNKRTRDAVLEPIAYYRAHEKMLTWISTMQQHSTVTTRRLWDICKAMLSDKIELRPSASVLFDQVREALEDGRATMCSECAYDAPPNAISAAFTGMDGSHQSPATSRLYRPSRKPIGPRGITSGVSASSDKALCHDSRGHIIQLDESGCIRQNAHEPASHLLSLELASPGVRRQSSNGITKELSDEPQALPGLSDVCPTPPSPKKAPCACACVVKKKQSSALLGLVDILAEYESASSDPLDPSAPTSRAYGIPIEPPPAYHEASSFPASRTVTGPRANGQPPMVGHTKNAAQVMETSDFGKDGSGILQRNGHEMWHPCAPRSLAHCLCHQCGARFVAPRANKCSRCSHIRCNECTSADLAPDNRRPRKAELDLVEIGSHLAPPAYSKQEFAIENLAHISTGDPLTELDADSAVLGLVISQHTRLGGVPGERFIQSCPSTFDRIHSADRSLSPHSISPPSSLDFAIEGRQQTQAQDYHNPRPTSTSSSTPSSSLHKSKKVKYGHEQQSKGQSSIQIRSRPFPPPEQTCPMNDYNYPVAVDSRDLTSRLTKLQKSHSTSNDGDYVSRLPRMQRTSSSESSGVFSHLPAFHKSQTSSTTSSNEVSRLDIVRTIPLTTTTRESVEISQGDFSKPTIRRRRKSNESTKSQKEFQYYGRHANTWLFNDFSVTGTVKKGWGKVFSGKNNGNAEN